MQRPQFKVRSARWGDESSGDAAWFLRELQKKVRLVIRLRFSSGNNEYKRRLVELT
jgi:hypothetical protein